MTFWQPFWILAAILEIKENNFPRNRFLGLENIHLDLFHCFLRHLQAKICKILDFGGHLGKMADRKKCSTFGVWLQTDLDSAAQNLMETIIKVYICLKTRFSYQMLGSKWCNFFFTAARMTWYLKSCTHNRIPCKILQIVVWMRSSHRNSCAAGSLAWQPMGWKCMYGTWGHRVQTPSPV